MEGLRLLVLLVIPGIVAVHVGLLLLCVLLLLQILAVHEL